MKTSPTAYLKVLLPFAFAFTLAVSTLSLISFEARLYGDFLAQLGLPVEQANSKIKSGFLDGYLDHYGIKNLKNIALNDRAAIAGDVAAYSKEYVSSDAFRKAYQEMKLRNKPAEPQKVLSPAELKAETIRSAKEAVANCTESLKKSTPQTKAIFEQVLDAAKRNLKDAEDPNNPNMKMYADNYAMMKKMNEEGYARSIKEWHQKYPDDYMPLVKSRLQEFLSRTENVDYNAETKTVKEKKIFVNPAYERKSNDWKMAYRAGKEPVEAARAYVKQWISELK